MRPELGSRPLIGTPARSELSFVQLHKTKLAKTDARYKWLLVKIGLRPRLRSLRSDVQATGRRASTNSAAKDSSSATRSGFTLTLSFFRTNQWPSDWIMRALNCPATRYEGSP